MKIMDYDKWYKIFGKAAIASFIIALISTSLYLAVPYIFCKLTVESSVVEDCVSCVSSGCQIEYEPNMQLAYDITMIFGFGEVIFIVVSLALAFVTIILGLLNRMMEKYIIRQLLNLLSFLVCRD